MNKIKNDWKLKSINFGFKKGWSCYTDERADDRYDGYIEFENGDQESFKFKIKKDMGQQFIDLIAEKIVTSADELADKLKESLNLK